MRKILLIFLLTCIGCTSTQVPIYLAQKNPYTRRFYVPYEKALSAVETALHQLGWVIEKKVDPAVFEQHKDANLADKNLLIFTKIRQTSLFLGTRYARMNLIIRSKGNLSDIEIRYLTISALPFKNIETYHNDSAVDRIFGRIAALTR